MKAMLLFSVLAVFFLPLANAASLTLNGGSTTLDGTKNYDSVSLRNGAVLYITPYDGTGTTGKLILDVNGDVIIDSTSKITGDVRGYRGGAGGAKGVCSTSGCTQTWSSGWSSGYDCPPVGGGGGGGEMGGSAGGSGKAYSICGGCGNQECSSWGNAYYSYPGGGGGGGGGGYGTAGGNGGDSTGVGGSGGALIGTLSGNDISMGAGGGGGGGGGSTGNTDNTGGGGGGNGGASLTINAKNIILRGAISMNGGSGGIGGSAASANTYYSSGCWGPWCWRSGPYYTSNAAGGAGGGGAGGGILLNTSGNVDVSYARITADGGSGAGVGGGGRIKVFYSGAYINTGATITAGTIYTFQINTPPTIPIQTPHTSYHNSGSTTVSWSASTDANGNPITYDVKVGTSSGGGNILNQAGIIGTTSSSFSITPTNTYYWSTRACDPYECSSWSAESSFSWRNSAPSAPSINPLPNNFSTQDSIVNMTITWEPSLDPDGDSVTYTYQFAKDIAFTSLVSQSNTVNPFGNIVMNDDSDYYIRVRAYDGHDYGQWSRIVHVTRSMVQGDILLTVGEEGLIIVKLDNLLSVPDKYTLELFGAPQKIAYWSWFDGHRYDGKKTKITVNVGPEKSANVAIKVFGGEASASASILYVRINSAATGASTEIAKNVYITYDTEGAFVQTPEFGWISYLAIGIIGAIFYFL